MGYSKDYKELREIFASKQIDKEYDGIEIVESTFNSQAHQILPGVDEYFCAKHQENLMKNFSFFTEVGKLEDNVHIKDIEVAENRDFTYQILRPKGIHKAQKVVLLFHGFNEKDWSKYLPWAKYICEKTNCSVVLFPIAFHMQRAPKHWSSKRDMYVLSESRKKRFPNIVHSTLSNVAISMRLHAMPQRFIWSGLQTYYDVIQFIEECKEDQNEFIDKDFDFDIFAYSIGGFLAQILKFSNYKNYFSKTKICLFCSGTTFNRLSPVSKFILDSESNVALYSFLVEHFDKFLHKDNVLNHYIVQEHVEGEIFHAMLDYKKMREARECLLKKYEKHFYAISLKKDTVIPSFEVMNTLKGAYRDINIKVDEMDFDRSYIHENPFPVIGENEDQIDADFNAVFDNFCEFLNT